MLSGRGKNHHRFIVPDQAPEASAAVRAHTSTSRHLEQNFATVVTQKQNFYPEDSEPTRKPYALLCTTVVDVQYTWHVFATSVWSFGQQD